MTPSMYKSAEALVLQRVARNRIVAAASYRQSCGRDPAVKSAANAFSATFRPAQQWWRGTSRAVSGWGNQMTQPVKQWGANMAKRPGAVGAVFRAGKPLGRIARFAGKSLLGPALGLYFAGDALHQYYSGQGAFDRDGNRKSRLALALRLAGSAAYSLPVVGMAAGMGLDLLGSMAQNKANRRYFGNMQRMADLGIDPNNPTGGGAKVKGQQLPEGWENKMEDSSEEVRSMALMPAAYGAYKSYRTLMPGATKASLGTRLGRASPYLALASLALPAMLGGSSSPQPAYDYNYPPQGYSDRFSYPGYNA